jgi:hypothetical protein
VVDEADCLIGPRPLVKFLQEANSVALAVALLAMTYRQVKVEEKELLVKDSQEAMEVVTTGLVVAVELVVMVAKELLEAHLSVAQACQTQF